MTILQLPRRMSVAAGTDTGKAPRIADRVLNATHIQNAASTANVNGL